MTAALETRTASPADVFCERIAAKVQVDENTGCWLWQGTRNPGGYGRVYRGDGKYDSPYRIAYVSVHGPIPDGLEIDHLCRVPSCCNPEHLEAVTHAENIRRGMAHGRKRPEPKTHCKRGHELTPANLLASKQGRRQCRKCANDGRNRRDREKRAEARQLRDQAMVGVLADAPEAASDDVAGTVEDDEAAAQT